MPSSNSKTGFVSVIQKGARYKVQRSVNGKRIQQGNFATPWEAALWNARNIKKEQTVAKTAEATAEGVRVEILQVVVTDNTGATGLAKGPSSSNETGF